MLIFHVRSVQNVGLIAHLLKHKQLPLLFLVYSDAPMLS